MSLTPKEEMVKIKAKCIEQVLGTGTKVLYKFAHCCTSPSWSLYTDFQPWHKETAHN